MSGDGGDDNDRGDGEGNHEDGCGNNGCQVMVVMMMIVVMMKVIIKMVVVITVVLGDSGGGDNDIYIYI